MKQDSEIQANVMEELKRVPSIKASEIGVSVKNGIVTLSGIVDSYPKKIAAERAVWQVVNVRGIAEEISVKLRPEHKRSDTEMAQAVMYALEWHSGLDISKIKILVDDGEVTIEGYVDWNYQRKFATKTISHIKGVNVIINNLKISEKPVSSEIKRDIEAAFKRSSSIDASKISVNVAGNTVTLKGNVRTWFEKNQAEHITWTMSGVSCVNNEIEINH